MRKVGFTLIALVASVSLVGCAAPVAGTWKLAPDAKPGKVSIAVMTLAEDGTFTANAREGDKSVAMFGCYMYKDGKLTFCPEGGGGMRSYDAKVAEENDALLITHGDATVKMVRVENCCKEGECKDGCTMCGKPGGDGAKKEDAKK